MVVDRFNISQLLILGLFIFVDSIEQKLLFFKRKYLFYMRFLEINPTKMKTT